MKSEHVLELVEGSKYLVKKLILLGLLVERRLERLVAWHYGIGKHARSARTAKHEGVQGVACLAWLIGLLLERVRTLLGDKRWHSWDSACPSKPIEKVSRKAPISADLTHACHCSVLSSSTWQLRGRTWRKKRCEESKVGVKCLLMCRWALLLLLLLVKLVSCLVRLAGRSRASRCRGWLRVSSGLI